MPKRRMIDPAIWDDPDVGRCDSLARLLFIGLFSLADDYGNILADPSYLRKTIFGYDGLTVPQVAELRAQVLSNLKSVKLYQVRGQEYIHFEQWTRYQHLKYQGKSEWPGPDSSDELARSHAEDLDAAAELEQVSQTLPKLGKVSPKVSTVEVSLVEEKRREIVVEDRRAAREQNPLPPQTAQAQRTEAETAAWTAWVNARGKMGLSANDWPDLEALCREYGPEWVEHAILDADAGRNGGSISRNFVKAVLERYHASGQQYPWLIPKGTRTQAQQNAADVEELRKYMSAQVEMGMSYEEANQRLQAKLPGVKPI